MAIYVIVGLLLAPIWVPIVMLYGIVKHLKGERTPCLSCGGRKWKLLGISHRRAAIKDDEEFVSPIIRHVPYRYFQCAQCGKTWKKQFASNWEIPTEDELKSMVPCR